MKSQLSKACLLCVLVLGNAAVAQQPDGKPSFEDINLYRVQVQITTGKGEKDGTNDRVYVKLNKADGRFYLNRHIDDFKRGSQVKYDVLSSSMTIGDIQFLQIGLAGDDKLCITKIALILNNEVVFSGPGKCLDNSATFTISSSQLRGDSHWGYNAENESMWRSPRRISKSTIVSLVEGSVGNQLSQEKRFKWDGKVGIKTANDHALAFHFKLERDVTGPNPKVDMYFDLEFACGTDGTLTTAISNVKFVPNGVVADLQNWVRSHSSEIVAGTFSAFGGGPASAAAINATIDQSGIEKKLVISTKMKARTPGLSAKCERVNVTPASDIELR